MIISIRQCLLAVIDGGTRSCCGVQYTEPLGALSPRVWCEVRLNASLYFYNKIKKIKQRLKRFHYHYIEP